MKLRTECPQCEGRIALPSLAAADRADCGRCGTSVPLDCSDALKTGGIMDRCCVCGNRFAYLHKDFSPGLGCLIVLVGIAFSYHTYGLSLVLCAVLDFVVYQMVGMVAVCYRCQAEYRGFEKHPHQYPFDMKVAEWHLKRHQKETGAQKEATS